MATIFEKLRLLALSAAHELLDKGIDEMSIPVLKQNLRDLKAAIEELHDAAASAEGDMNTAKTGLATINAQVTELNTNIDFILGDGDDKNDHLAVPLQARLIGLEEQQKMAEGKVQAYRESMEAVDGVISGLQLKYDSRYSQLGQLQSQVDATEAKNKAAEAIGIAANVGDGPSVDNMAAKINREANIADAKLRRAMGNMQTGLGNDALVSEAQARLALRKAKLQK